MKRKITNVIYLIVFSGLAIIAFLSFFSISSLPKSIKLFAVQTGSMEPAIKKGSLIVVQPREKYQKEDIVTFKISPDANIKNPKSLVTHRIIEIKESKGEMFYVTKGDANESADMENRPQSAVLGMVIYKIPYLGYPAAYAKTPIGFLILVGIPASLIFYTELSKILNELSAMSLRKKRKNMDKKEIRITRIKLP